MNYQQIPQCDFYLKGKALFKASRSDNIALLNPDISSHMIHNYHRWAGYGGCRLPNTPMLPSLYIHGLVPVSMLCDQSVSCAD